MGEKKKKKIALEPDKIATKTHFLFFISILFRWKKEEKKSILCMLNIFFKYSSAKKKCFYLLQAHQTLQTHQINQITSQA